MGKYILNICLLFILYGNFMIYVISQTLVDEDNLHTKLFANYNKELRPRPNFGDVTNVTVKFYITTIKNYDEKNGQLSVAGSILFAWKDERLGWDPSQYGYMYYTHVPKKKVWTPPFIIVNAYDDFSSLGTNDKLEDYMWLMNDGGISWSTGAYFEVICSANVVYFPFDTQNCTLMFLPWYFSANELKIVPAESTFDLRYYQENGLWDLKTTSMYLQYFSDGTENIRFSLTMKRKSAFYIMNTLIPMCIIGTLNIFVFLLPNDSGERIGLCVTLLLAITVFMTIQADALPNTVTPSLSVNNYFLFFDININVIILLCVILIARLYHKDEGITVSPFYKSTYKTLRRLFRCKKRVTAGEDCPDNNPTNAEKPQVQNKMAAEDKLDNGALFLSRNKTESIENISWKDIGEMFDKICFVFFIALYIIRFIAYFSVFAPHM